jgi:hypothetical protein
MRKKIKKLVIKNPGSIPATVIFKLPNNPSFTILKTKEYTLMPKESKAFELEFCPKTEESFCETLLVSTVNNPYEKIKIQLMGEGYFDILAFEDLEDRQDTLIFPDIVLTHDALNVEPESVDLPIKILKNNKIVYDVTLPGEQYPKLATKKVKVRNYSNKTVRFEWVTPTALIEVRPSVGHIGGLKTREFKVMIYNKGLTEFKIINSKLQLEFEEILNMSEESDKVFEGWDNRARLKKTVNREDLKNHLLMWENQNKETTNTTFNIQGANDEGLFEVFYEMPEPEFEKVLKEEKKPVKGKKTKTGPRSISMEVHAAIDIPRVTCDVQEIIFDRTMMYSERVFSLVLKNLSQIQVPIFCKIVKWNPETQEEVPDCGYFAVSPMERILLKESDNEFMVKFLPLECDFDVDRTLQFCLPPSK